jgi:hypothetical protein
MKDFPVGAHLVLNLVIGLVGAAVGIFGFVWGFNDRLNKRFAETDERIADFKLDVERQFRTETHSILNRIQPDLLISRADIIGLNKDVVYIKEKLETIERHQGRGRNRDQ